MQVYYRVLFLQFLIYLFSAAVGDAADNPSQSTSIQGLTGETSREDILLTLAKQQFAYDLLPAEEEVFRAAVKGKAAWFGEEAGSLNAVIRADRLVWLCTDPIAVTFVSRSGLYVTGAKIDGDLDLGWANIMFPLSCQRCNFTGPIRLSRAHLASLILENSSFMGFDGEDLSVDQDIVLSACKIQGEVRLNDAQVGGGLWCDKAEFSSPSGRTLDIRGAKIARSVSFRAVLSKGEISLAGAEIGGSLYCDHAHLINPSGLVLNGNAAKIRDSLLLGSLAAEGGIRLVAAEVANTFQLSGMSGDFTLDLRSANVGTLFNPKNSWPRRGNLSLQGFVFQRFDDAASLSTGSLEDWLLLQRGDTFLAQPFDQTIAALRNMGQEELAFKILIFKQHIHALYANNPLDWLWYNWLVGVFIRYHFLNPFYAVEISILVMLIGAVLFHFGYRCGLITPTSETAYQLDKTGMHLILRSYPTFSSIIYSVETFVPLIKLDMRQYWMPNPSLGPRMRIGRLELWHSGDFLRAYLWFHIIAGYVLAGFWVAGLAGAAQS